MDWRWAFGLLALCFGCAHAPQQRFELRTLEVTGNEQLDDEEIETKIASRQTPRFLGVFPGVIYDREVFNRFVLERDLQRVERIYRSRGFYEARARAARISRSASQVHVEIVVEEGAPVLIARIDVHGLERLPPALRETVLATATGAVVVGERFEEEAYTQSAKSIANSLADSGYARATVRKAADVDLPRRRASIGYWVEPGVVAELGAISFDGIGDLPEQQLRRTLGIKAGDVYSQSELDDAERALLDLGVFGSVNIEVASDGITDLPNGKQRVPLVVKVERSKLRSLRLGGGVQFDSIKSDVHLTAGWEDQSFLGGMRKLVLEATPGAVVHPTRLPTFEAPEHLLAQGKVRAEFREPGFLEGRVNGVVQGQVSVAPALLSSAPTDTILGYRDYRASVGVERSFRKLYAALFQNLQINSPFDYVGEINDALKRVIIAYPSLLLALDLRDNPMKPRRGVYGAVQTQIASVFGDARDVRVAPEIRGYLPLSRRTTLATRGALGILLPGNYGDTVAPNAATRSSGLTGEAPDVLATWVRDIQLMFFRGFFAGGAGSNRGYAAREIGPHGAIPYYIPGQAAEQTDASCSAELEGGASQVCDLPLGGFTLWELSAEVRYPVSGDLSGTLFVDAADVSPQQLEFRWRPHLSVGVGLRYDTPVGPVRADVGYRIPGAQAPRNAPDEGVPATLLSLPIAVSFGIGESY